MNWSMRATATTISVLLISCGGGGGGGSSDGGGGASGTGSTPIPITKSAVGGYWYGYWSPTGQSRDAHIEGIVTEAGKTFFIEETGAIYSGTLQSSGTNFTGSLVSALLPGVTYKDGATSANAALSGTIEKPDEQNNTQWLKGYFTLTLSDGTQLAGPTGMGYEKEYYEYGSSFEILAGNYKSQPGPYMYNNAVLNIAGNGDLFLQDPKSGCVLNGRVKIINKLYNAYDFELSHSSCTDPSLTRLNGIAFRGLAWFYRPNVEFIAYAHGTVGGKLVGYYMRFIAQ